jgi:hypothetical protein
VADMKIGRVEQLTTDAPDLGPNWGKVHGKTPFQCDECERLKETVRRLNRRCQIAEAAANLKVEEWDKRSKGAGRGYLFSLGKLSAFAAPSEQRALHEWIAIGLRAFVAAHGPSLSGSGIGSAAKRIASEVLTRFKALKLPEAVDAVDPHAASTGTPSTRV